MEQNKSLSNFRSFSVFDTKHTVGENWNIYSSLLQISRTVEKQTEKKELGKHAIYIIMY